MQPKISKKQYWQVAVFFREIKEENFEFGMFCLGGKWRHLWQSRRPARRARACPRAPPPAGLRGRSRALRVGLPRRLLVLRKSAAGSRAQPGPDP